MQIVYKILLFFVLITSHLNISYASDNPPSIVAITCNELLELDVQNQEIITFWIDGYLSSIRGNSLVTDSYIEILKDQILSYCYNDSQKTIYELVNDFDLKSISYGENQLEKPLEILNDNDIYWIDGFISLSSDTYDVSEEWLKSLSEMIVVTMTQNPKATIGDFITNNFE